jgi:hypothetical protein
MKKILLAVVLLNGCFAFTQEKKEKHESLEVKSMTYGLGIYKDEHKAVNYGFANNLEFSTRYKSHLFSVNLGTDFGFANRSQNSDKFLHFVSELDLLYGREFKISKYFHIETHAGAGYITQSSVFEDGNHNALGIPVEVKLVFAADNYWSYGLSPGANFNNVNSIYALRFFLQYNYD